MRERMQAGEPYLADDPELAAMLSHAQQLAHTINTTDPSDTATVSQLLDQLFGKIGQGTEIRPPLYVDYGVHTSIGERCFANFGLVVLDVVAVNIGDDVLIGPNVQLLTATHPLEAEPRRAKWESAAPISIGDNVWLGGGVIVCPGVTIGENTVVGAGSVVVHDLPPNVLVVGTPARPIRALPDPESVSDPIA